MFIEFYLPEGVQGQIAASMYHLVREDLDKWSNRYNVSYRCKHVKYRLRVTFDRDQDYSFFVTTWNPQDLVKRIKFRVITDLNNRQ